MTVGASGLLSSLLIPLLISARRCSIAYSASMQRSLALLDMLLTSKDSSNSSFCTKESCWASICASAALGCFFALMKSSNWLAMLFKKARSICTCCLRTSRILSKNMSWTWLFSAFSAQLNRAVSAWVKAARTCCAKKLSKC